MKGFLNRGWKRILPGCGRTSALSHGATLAARCIHEPQPISNHPVGLGFPHPAGRYRPGGSEFTFPGCWSCRDMDGFPTRGWEITLSGCGGTLGVVPRGKPRRALAPGAPVNQQSPSGVGVSTPCGAVSTREIYVFVPRLLELYRYGRIRDPGMGNYHPRVRRDLGVVPRGNSRRVLASRAPANQQSPSGAGVSTPCGAVSTRGI